MVSPRPPPPPPLYYAEMEDYEDSLVSHHFPTFLLLSCVGGKNILGLIHYGSSSDLEGYVVLEREDNLCAWLFKHIYVLRT